MSEHENCHCHEQKKEHEHDHGECHCHEHHEHHEHDHGECHCHDHHEHHHDHDECGCGCGCGHDHGEHEKGKKATILRYALGAIPVILGFMSFIPFYIPLVCAVVGYLIFGIEVYRGMIKGFARKKIFTEFTLMCVATLGAFAIGEYADAAALMYLYSLGETISDGAYSRSKRTISELMEITPEYATLRTDNGGVRKQPDEICVGDVILVNAGERIPLDGVVCGGGGSADTSSVTGEAKPLELYEGVECPSGSMLTEGSVYIKVTREYHNSVVYRLKAAVDEANKRRSSAEKKITRFAAVFTPIAFAVAACIFAVGAIITGNVVSWLKSAIMVLVVSCPCSLVLSVPLTYFAGLGRAAREGIVFRGGEIMDRTAALGCIAFDKTGTVTESRLSFDGATMLSDMDEESFLRLAHTVLTHSPHAAARAFCESVDARMAEAAESVENISGRGVICTLAGKKVIFGNARLMNENGINAPESTTTCIYGAQDGTLLGRLDFSSRLKSGVAESLQGIKARGVERIALISGDAKDSVALTCAEAGIEEYYHSCAPDEKLGIFERIAGEQKNADKKKYTAFCGDGLNDSAAIAIADVGIAMGGCGSALTVENADIVLMDDDPSKIATAIDISRRTSRIASSNIALSLGIKIGVLALSVTLASLGVEAPIELAIVADVGAAVVAVLNSLRAAS